MDPFPALLHDLEATHQELLDAAAAYEAMLRQRCLDLVHFSKVRLKLTSANGKRRMMIEKIAAMLEDLSQGDADRIRQLRAECTESVLRASQHISVWTVREVADNWPGYIEASRDIPAGVRATIRTDKRVLAPLLAGAASATA